jgi:hypothetical protein
VAADFGGVADGTAKGAIDRTRAGNASSRELGLNL